MGELEIKASSREIGAGEQITVKYSRLLVPSTSKKLGAGVFVVAEKKGPQG